MNVRKSIAIGGFRHGDLPIPVASRVRNIVATGGLPGVDLTTGTIPSEPEAQVVNAFIVLRKVLEAAAVTPEEVVRVTVYVKDAAVREWVNREWILLFPDAASRPARHMLNYALPEPLLVQLDALACAAD